jgi:hypothetical protein
VALHACLDRAEDELGRGLVQSRQQVPGEHFGVACLPSTVPSHLSSVASRWVRSRPMICPNDRSVLRSRRVATRIWCTASGSSRRTIGSRLFSLSAYVCK